MVKKILANSYVYLILLFIYAPILLLVAFSFTDATLIGQWDGFSLALFPRLFANKTIMTALLNTLLVAFVSSTVATILGTIGAIGNFYSKKRMQGFISATNQISISNAEIVTALSLALTFLLIFKTRNFVTLTLGHVVLSTPFVLLSITPKLKQMDPNIYEAALDLGATPTRALFQIVIPEIMPGIFSGFLLALTLSLDDYIITVFTRESSFQTLSTYIYDQTKKPLPPELRALTTLIFTLMVGVVIFLTVKNNKKNKNIGEK